MKAKHTPGPWNWTASDPNGAMIVNGAATIADWPASGGTVEACANARLIAEAPAMAEALAAMEDAARLVAETWASGDLASAARILMVNANEARAILARIEG